MRIGRGLAALGAALLLLTACGGDDDTKTISTDQGDVTVTKDGDDASVKVETDEGSGSFGAGTKLPESFPGDVPTPDDLELQSAVTSNEDQDYALTYALGDKDAGDVLTDYRDALEEAGFTIEDDASANVGGGQFSTLRATGNGWSVSSSSISATGGVLVIAVTKDG
jgi:hypothetical protein